jgi:amino acid transporter
MGEVKDPRRTVPFALAIGLLVIASIYSLLQFVTVSTIGNVFTDNPLVQAASVLTGRSGAVFVAVAAMISTYGTIALGILFAPRLAYAFSAHGDLPHSLTRLHPRYNTPVLAIVIFSSIVWLLALSGTFLLLAALTAGAVAIQYGAICAALIRLRRIQPNASALRLSWGPVFAVLGIAICLVLITRLTPRELVLMGITAAIAAANWGLATKYGINKTKNTIATRRVVRGLNQGDEKPCR